MIERTWWGDRLIESRHVAPSDPRRTIDEGLRLERVETVAAERVQHDFAAVLRSVLAWSVVLLAFASLVLVLVPSHELLRLPDGEGARVERTEPARPRRWPIFLLVAPRPPARPEPPPPPKVVAPTPGRDRRRVRRPPARSMTKISCPSALARAAITFARRLPAC